MLNQGTGSFYAYYFSQPAPNSFPNTPCGITCSHGGETSYVWGSTKFDESDERQQVTDDAHNAWANFAKTGNPNVGDAISAEWNQAGENYETYVIKAGETGMVNDPMGPIDSKDRCDLWDGFDIYNVY